MRLKKSIISIVSVASLFATHKFCKIQTGKFTVLQVKNNFNITNKENIEEPFCQEVQDIFNQPFTFLNKGRQSFVFASSDGKYVLKLMNNRYQRRMFYFSILSHLPFVSSWASSQYEYTKQKLIKTFESFKIAQENLKEETGFLFIHDNKNSPLHKIKIVDKMGRSHDLSSKNTSYILQKRASPFYPTLLQLKNNSKHKEARICLDSLFDLLILRCKKGIKDSDALLRTNFGFIGLKAVEIDVGPFSIDETFKNPEMIKKEVFRITKSLKHWLEENYFELLPDLEELYKIKLSKIEL